LRQARPVPGKESCSGGSAGAPPRRHSQLRRGLELPILGENGTDRCRACHHRFPAGGRDEF
jgi:hypothetical protein